ncbi:hypothetical protein ACFYS7_38750 [Streptomyces avermitilis]|uniref:hypothetical protein n=1 Tax=Streptomyces avermitilis TaxID=33903 RepID=UPI00368E3C7C
MVAQNLVPGVVMSVGGLAAAMIGARWWAVVVCLGLSLAVTALQLVFPQESEHRLGWWKNRRAYRHRRSQLRQTRRHRGL